MNIYALFTNDKGKHIWIDVTTITSWEEEIGPNYLTVIYCKDKFWYVKENHMQVAHLINESMKTRERE
jgi:hypothetical protein